MKINLDLFAKNYLHIGPKQYEKHNYNRKNLYLLKDGSSVVNLKTTLSQYKTALNLITDISKNKGEVLVTHLDLHSSSFTNKEQRKIVLPSIAVFINNDSKDNIISCKKLGIPTIQMINDVTAKQQFKATYTVLANPDNKAKDFHYNIINYAIKKGKAQELLLFSKKKFPRLGSNQ